MSTLSYAPRVELPPVRPVRLFLLPLLMLVGAWTIGALTNFVNGLICPWYFQVVIGQMYGGELSLGDIVFQGLLESTFFGIVAGVIVTLVYGLTTHARCSLVLPASSIAVGLLVALFCWSIGGALGAAWGAISPESFRQTFPIARYAYSGVPWATVGGAIWGVYLGGVLSTLTICLLIPIRWKQLLITRMEALTPPGAGVSADPRNPA